MAQTCKTCKRPDVDEINKLITTGQSLRSISSQCGISHAGIQRHKDHCIKHLFAEVIEKKRAGLLGSVDEVRKEIDRVAQNFPDNGPVQVQLIARRLDALDKEAKLTGAYQQEQKNVRDEVAMARAVAIALVEQGWQEGDAYAYAQQRYNTPLLSNEIN